MPLPEQLQSPVFRHNIQKWYFRSTGEVDPRCAWAVNASERLCVQEHSEPDFSPAEVNVKTSSDFSHVELKRAGGVYPAYKWEVARACLLTAFKIAWQAMSGPPASRAETSKPTRTVAKSKMKIAHMYLQPGRAKTGMKHIGLLWV